MVNVTGGFVVMQLLAVEVLSDAITGQLYLHLLVPNLPIFFMCIHNKAEDTCNYIQLLAELNTFGEPRY
jgi:phosphatidylethanolamine-binding protein (PEBP) family uncharacterized protein